LPIFKLSSFRFTGSNLGADWEHPECIGECAEGPSDLVFARSFDDERPPFEGEVKPLSEKK
jgi:NADH:ubiquinone oxidoreductase subunit E